MVQEKLRKNKIKLRKKAKVKATAHHKKLINSKINWIG